ncbi:unnamed protein product [Didymodactylos carnosus]|uniref:RRM domain-containing protein n=1 Tax=Didymodactylos carnosus TaxID=1234261 RepID=A0A813VWH4_9BILA|nr:unnamed protein product [Didymodactylos carnosus]CAF0846312.1 unnamed protein product [Didymodactylos carnosus]CAF3572189.1 unnamed protein product [Didymodactylos carnosus]CAF3633958.1 unnamed protein product [Didymodactylos carnosus]
MSAIETKLYVTNFPSSTTRQQLQLFFGRFGRVQECAIMWNSYAFVHYSNIDEAKRALEQSNGALFLNRKLIVQVSTSRFRPNPKEITNGGGGGHNVNVDNGFQHAFPVNGDIDGWYNNNTRQKLQQHQSSRYNYMNESNYDTGFNHQPYLYQNSCQEQHNSNNNYSPSFLIQQNNNQYLPSYYQQHDSDNQHYHHIVNGNSLLPTVDHSTPSPSSISNDQHYYNRIDSNMNQLQQQYTNRTVLNYNEIGSSGASSCSSNGSTNGDVENKIVLQNNGSDDATVAADKSVVKTKKTIRTDVGTSGEIPKLYVTNLPDNCKANDLQRLFSNYGVVVDCVILWDYYAFITYRKFPEAELALQTLHGQPWKDRRLIVEWSRASGRRQTTTTSTGIKKDQLFNTSSLLNGGERQQHQSSYMSTGDKDFNHNLFMTNNSNLSQQPLSPTNSSLSQLDQSPRVRPATLSYLPHYHQHPSTTMISPAPTVQQSPSLPQSPQQQAFSMNRNLLMLSLLQQQQSLEAPSSPVSNHHTNGYLGRATPSPPNNGVGFSEKNNTPLHNSSFGTYASSGIDQLANNNITFECLTTSNSTNESPFDNLLFDKNINTNPKGVIEHTQQHTMSDIVALLDECTSDQSGTKPLSDLQTTSTTSSSSSTRTEPSVIFNNESFLSSLLWNIDFPSATGNPSIKQSVLNKLFESTTDCFQNHQENIAPSSQQTYPYSYHLPLTTAPENNHQSSMYFYNGWH